MAEAQAQASGTAAQVTVATVTQTETVVLHLKKPAEQETEKRRIQWAEETVDNEGMGRKSSKCCCIYHKPRAFGESSDESDFSGDEHEHGPNCDHDEKKHKKHAHHQHQAASS